MASPKRSTPHAVDIHVGRRIRMRRKFLKMSQEALGSLIGLTFQQVQKYELGRNRVSASKLYEIGKALHIEVTYFFEGLEDGDRTNDDAVSAHDKSGYPLLMVTGGVALARAFPHISSAKVRRGVLDLAQTLAAEDNEASVIG